MSPSEFVENFSMSMITQGYFHVFLLRWNASLGTAALITMMVLCPAGRAQQLVSLMAPKEAWSFDNGSEFPGASGGLSVDPQAKRDGRDSLKLVGDFTKGGNYVQGGRMIDNLDIRELSIWVRNPDADQFTLRLNDSTGQTHQIDLKTEARAEWQRVVFPLERFFARRGQADAVTGVAKYESWGGAKDGQWHGPAKAIYVLLGNTGGHKVHSLWLNEVAILPRPVQVPGAEIPSVMPLEEIVEGEHDWRFNRGDEYPGAKGSLSVVKDQPVAGQSCLKLAGDFTAGGVYVAAIKNLKELDVKDVRAFRLRVKSGNAAFIGIQLGDASGQTHQRPWVPITADGQWHDLVVKPAEIAGGEHWGGTNDGKWHGPPTHLSISLSAKADEKTKQPVLYLADIQADVLLAVFVQPSAFKNDFDGPDSLGHSWAIEGEVSIDTKTAFEGSGSLVLARSLDAIDRPCSATSPKFKAAPGPWQIHLACKSDLHSPDDSYQGVLNLECLDGGGKAIERIPLVELFGQHDWRLVNKRVELPRGVAAACFRMQINKADGRFWVDDLAAAAIAPAPRKDERIAPLLFSTARVGNLLFPNDPRQLSATVEAVKPMRDSQVTLSYEVRDYWGAEQMRPATVSLKRSGKKGDRFIYQANIDLSQVPLETGRYYEVHGTILQEGEPFRNFTSFAILPEAETKRYQPEEVPFTSRNWDNRFPEYFQLSDRLGLRTCGVWGGWSSKPPYKPEAPGIELCQKYGMGVLTGTPIHSIELGEKEYGKEALLQGVRTFLERFGKYRPLIVSLGNEPHGTGERVRANVEAYRTVYEEIKKIDPRVFVVATPVEPNEEYFRAGYGNWCDAFDFHVYEGHEHVREAIEKYHALMQKYATVKPIWSTELGLNSQGMTRHVVAAEMIKVFVTFFAAGGAKGSWFGLLYPDPEAKLFGSSGDAHNVFDCRYSSYSPRLDAIAYYNVVNAIAIKKFVSEKQYPSGISAFLFRDSEDRTLQVLWKDRTREDVFVPLPGVKQVQVIRVDGSRRMLDASGKGITLSITEDPLLLLYEGGGNALAPALGPPVATLQSPPQVVARHGSTTLTVGLNSASANDLDLIAPPFWTVKKAQGTPGNGGQPTVRFTLTAPEASPVREADFMVTLSSNGNRQGELYYHAPLSE